MQNILKRRDTWTYITEEVNKYIHVLHVSICVGKICYIVFNGFLFNFLTLSWRFLKAFWSLIHIYVNIKLMQSLTNKLDLISKWLVLFIRQYDTYLIIFIWLNSKSNDCRNFLIMAGSSHHYFKQLLRHNKAYTLFQESDVAVASCLECLALPPSPW